MSTNPYTPPRAAVADVTSASDEFQPIRLWSAKGRIGRLRYLAYSTGAGLIVGFVGGFLTAAFGQEVAGPFVLLAYVPFLIFAFLSAIKRSHDMNWSGWTTLLLLIPFVGLIWLFKSGTQGENDYGLPPPPNTTGVKILGFVAPIVAIIGILAAVALPAYQEYVRRAQAIERSK